MFTLRTSTTHTAPSAADSRGHSRLFHLGTTGRAYSHLETNDFTARIEDYQRLQYNNLFGGQDRLAAFFDPESGGATGG